MSYIIEYVKTDENDLIKQAQNGVVSAWEELVYLYMKDAYNFCLKLTNGNHNDADDISQSAFIKVYQNLKDFRGDASFKSWLYKIITNLYINQCKKKKPISISDLPADATILSPGNERSRQAGIKDINIEDMAEVKSDDNSQVAPPLRAETVEMMELIKNKINLLPPQQKAVLVMHTYEQMSIKDIAETIGASYAAVKMNLSLARRRLLKELKGYL